GTRRWSRSTTPGAGVGRWSGPRAARRRATTSRASRASGPSLRRSTCTTPRSPRSRWRTTTPWRPPVGSPTPRTSRAARSICATRWVTTSEDRSLDLRDLDGLLRDRGAGVLADHRGLDRHLGAGDDHAADGHGDPVPRFPRLQDGAAAGGPEGRRDRRRGRGARLLPAVLLVAPVVRWIAGGDRGRRGSRRLVADDHRHRARCHRPDRMGLRVLPRRARPLSVAGVLVG